MKVHISRLKRTIETLQELIDDAESAGIDVEALEDRIKEDNKKQFEIISKESEVINKQIDELDFE